MTEAQTELLQLKKEIYRIILEKHDRLITELQDSIRDLQSSANEETKSSVGDKYETSRSMVQLEIEKQGEQLQERINARKQFLMRPPERLADIVQSGAVVITSIGNFYLLFNAGEVQIDKTKYIAISLQSPLAKVILGKKRGESVTFNTKTIHITQVF
jgi:transcription elongation GreA/GreB family factor